MIIAISCNYIDVFKEFLKYYSEPAKKCKFVICKQNLIETNYSIRELNDYTFDDIKKVMNDNNITDFEFVTTSDIVDKLNNNIKGDFYNLVKNMIGPMLLSWYINKYIDNEQDILFVEEDILVRFNENYIKKLESENNNYAYFLGTFNSSAVDGTDFGFEWCKIQNKEENLTNIYKYVIFRHICGAPIYIKHNSFDGFDEYIEKVFTSKRIYDCIRKSNSWHHMNIDEYFRSCSPIQYSNFDTDIVKITFIGKKGIERYNPNYNKVWNNCILHLAGSFKIEKLYKVVSNIREI